MRVMLMDMKDVPIAGKRVVMRRAVKPVRVNGNCAAGDGIDDGVLHGAAMSSTYAVKSFFFAVEGSDTLGESLSYRLPLLSRERTPAVGSMSRTTTSSSAMRAMPRPDEEARRGLWSSASPRTAEGRHGANAFFYAWDRYKNEGRTSTSPSSSSSTWRLSTADAPSYERMRSRSRANGIGDSGLRISSLQLERGSKRNRGRIATSGGVVNGASTSAWSNGGGSGTVSSGSGGGLDSTATISSSSTSSIGTGPLSSEHAKHSYMIGRKVRRQATPTPKRASTGLSSSSSPPMTNRRPEGFESVIRKAPIHVRLNHNDLRSLLLNANRQHM